MYSVKVVFFGRIFIQTDGEKCPSQSNTFCRVRTIEVAIIWFANREFFSTHLESNLHRNIHTVVCLTRSLQNSCKRGIWQRHTDIAAGKNCGMCHATCSGA